MGEYADDTSIINASIEEEVPKLECYRKSAEEYELEIQWRKTFILRKNIPKRDDGKAAGLPAPFNEVKQTKTERMLGLQIGINGAQQEMIKDRLDKAQKGWDIGQKFFLKTKINKKARIQLFNASIRPILQYGMTSQKINDVNIKKMQQKLPKMLRKMEEKEMWQKRAKEKDEGRPAKQLRNKAIRRKWKIPSIRSSLKKDRLCYNIRARKTKSSYYITYSEKINKDIDESTEELKELKKKLKHYDGKEYKKETEVPNEEEKEKIKKEEMGGGGEKKKKKKKKKK